MSSQPSTIHKFNIFYTLLKTYQLLVFHLYYKKVKVVGRKNIPYGSPIIFTPNHQNALMDALIVLDTARISPVFMARADIFRNKTQKKILTFLKMLPVYRMRDGAEELSKNDDTFIICLDILRDCCSVCLMPEGNHGDKRRLRPLVKGTFRIAFKAHEEFGHKNPVMIVPVGIDFGHYQKMRQDLLVIYGKPIEVSEYMDAFHENPAKAMNSLKERLKEEIKKIIIHIESDEYYDMCQDLRTIYNSRMRNRAGIKGNGLYKRFEADKQMISIIEQNIISDPEKMKGLSEKVSEYMETLKSLNLRNWVIERKSFSLPGIFLRSVLLVLTLPIFIIGYISNIIPYTVPLKAIKNVKDPQFISSFKFAVALLFFPVYYAIIGIIAGILTGPAWIPWAIMLVFLLSGYYAMNFTFSLKKLLAAIRFRTLMRKKDYRIIRTINLHSQIAAIMNGITDRFIGSLIKTEERGWNEK